MTGKPTNATSTEYRAASPGSADQSITEYMYFLSKALVPARVKHIVEPVFYDHRVLQPPIMCVQNLWHRQSFSLKLPSD